MDYSDLRAVFINCTLKRSPEVSNTDGLASVSMETMRRRGVAVDASAPSTTRSPPASGPDMTEHGWEAMNILYSLQHLGYTIPPQADSGWIGEAGQRLHEPQHDVPDLEPSCTWPGCSRTRAASPPTATSAQSGRRLPL